MSIFSRREFVKVISLGGGALVLGFYIPFFAQKDQRKSGSFSPNVWIKIDKDGITTITIARSEMGQGVWTSLSMLIAEELEADWSKIKVEQAITDSKYGDMTTGGSSSISESWDELRQAGAIAREMLISAAAKNWSVNDNTCSANNGYIIHEKTNRKISYGELVDLVSDIKIPKEVKLKEPSEFRIIGKNMPRLDTRGKIDGSAEFGMDVKIQGMLVAVVERPPIIGGKVKNYDAAKALEVKGVKRVIEIPSGIAVVADSTWQALKGREALSVKWEDGENAALNSEGIKKLFEEKINQNGTAVKKEGNFKIAIRNAYKKIDAIYEVPFLAHATMEPMNCTASVHEGGVEIWAPTQAPQWAQKSAAEALKISPEKVKIHTTFIGGAFGRRLMSDFLLESVLVSKEMKAPVKVVWTREDDMANDFYRPASMHRFQAGIDKSGRIIAWRHHIVAPSIMAQIFGDNKSQDAVDGASNLPYYIPNLLVEYSMANTAVPVGWWRSVYNSQNAFANECVIDELAEIAGVNSLYFRIKHLKENSPLISLLQNKTLMDFRDNAKKEGKHIGIACHSSFGSHFAEAAEITVEKGGNVRVKKVLCILDCGQVVNPDTIKAQVEGAIVFGLSAALKGEITIKNGAIVQNNFDDYPILSIDEMPEVEVQIASKIKTIGGIGEPGLPPIAPAVCNAIYSATGKRIRKLPIKYS